MALVKCKECGKEISDSAKSCPECGFIYKKEKTMTSKKVVGIVLAVLVTCGALFFGVTYLIFDFIPQMKVNNELKKYYGTWELVEDNFIELNENYGVDRIEDYKALKEIVINEDNLESQSSRSSAGFNTPKNGFAITTYPLSYDEGEYYFFAELGKLIEQEANDEYWKELTICFKLEGDMLIQSGCGLDDNTTISVGNIKYKRK